MNHYTVVIRYYDVKNWDTLFVWLRKHIGNDDWDLHYNERDWWVAGAWGIGINRTYGMAFKRKADAMRFKLVWA